MGFDDGHDCGVRMTSLTILEKSPARPIRLRDFGATPLEYHSKRLHLKAALMLATTGTHRPLTQNEALALKEQIEKAL